jgi:hypothetical protein
MVNHSKVVSVVIVGILILELAVFYLLMTGTYTSPLCLQ